MLIKGLVDEDFVNYKVPSMFISTNTCTFKCDIENGSHICQNGGLAKQPSVDIQIEYIIRRYMHNGITKAIVFGGLEPMDQLADLYDFIFALRNDHNCKDTVVIYTGYTEEEMEGRLAVLRALGDVVVKFGRYRCGDTPHFDPVLGVMLASDNQYAVNLSDKELIN